MLGDSFYAKMKKIIQSYDGRLEQDTLLNEKEKKVTYIVFWDDDMDREEIADLQRDCLKVYQEESKANPRIMELSFLSESISFACRCDEMFRVFEMLKNKCCKWRPVFKVYFKDKK